MIRLMHRRSITFRVPSSIANMGPGFDVLSIALEKPFLDVTLSLSNDFDGIELKLKGKYSDRLILNKDANSGYKALRYLMDEKRIRHGLVLTIDVGIPPRKGLGLSGAEAAGAILCANELFELRLSKDLIVQYASMGEPGMHLDNVSASVFGGFNIVVKDYITGAPKVYNIKPPVNLGIAIIVPSVEKHSTMHAREVLPENIPLKSAVENMSRLSAIVFGFATGDVEAILKNISWDIIVERARASAEVYGKGIDWDSLLEEKLELWRKYRIAETICGAGPSRALWFDSYKHKDVIEDAINFVIDRIKSYGYVVEELFITRPSEVGGHPID